MRCSFSGNQVNICGHCSAKVWSICNWSLVFQRSQVCCLRLFGVFPFSLWRRYALGQRLESMRSSEWEWRNLFCDEDWRKGAKTVIPCASEFLLRIRSLLYHAKRFRPLCTTSGDPKAAEPRGRRVGSERIQSFFSSLIPRFRTRLVRTRSPSCGRWHPGATTSSFSISSLVLRSLWRTDSMNARTTQPSSPRDTSSSTLEPPTRLYSWCVIRR